MLFAPPAKNVNAVQRMNIKKLIKSQNRRQSFGRKRNMVINFREGMGELSWEYGEKKRIARGVSVAIMVRTREAVFKEC